MERFEQHTDSKIFFPVMLRELRGETAGADFNLPVPNHSGVYRPGPDGKAQCLGVVGSRYEPIKMRSLCDMAETALTKIMPASAFADMTVRDKMIDGGARVWREYVFPSLGAVLRQRSARATTIAYKAVVGNSYDGSMSAYAGNGSEDLICENGMVNVTWNGKVVHKHTSGFDMEYFKVMFERGVEEIHGHINVIKEWNDRGVDPARVSAWLDHNFSERRAERFDEQLRDEYLKRGSTLWAVYSALTFYASHNSERFPVRVIGGNDNRVEATLVNRQEEIHRLVRQPEFLALAVAA